MPVGVLPKPKWQEPPSVFDPLSTTLLRRVGHFMGADDPDNTVLNLVNPMIAVGGPEAIPAIKQRGADLVKALLERAKMPRYSLGANLEEEAAKSPQYWKNYKGQLNTDIPEPLAKAMTYAQQRWPRVFGHIHNIGDVDSSTAIQYFPGTVRGESGNIVASKGGKITPTGLSKIGVSPSGIEHVAKMDGVDPAPEYSKVFGHELLHSADRLVRPNLFDELYGFTNKDPWGYAGNSSEIRANLFGERYKQIVDAIEKHLQETGQVNAKIRVPNTDKGTTLRMLDLK